MMIKFRRSRVIWLIFVLLFLNVAASAGPYNSRLPLLSDGTVQQAPYGSEAGEKKDTLRITLARNPEGTDAPSRLFIAASSDSRKGYTVTFDLDGKGMRIGGGELVQTVPYGGSAVAPEVEADPGWEFVGWSTSFNNITAPLTVVARYNADIYTVTFDLAGKGTRIGGGKLEQTVFFGYPAIAPIVQANTGWVFEGWDLPFDVVTGPLTVTALYGVATYPVTFDLDDKGSRVGGGELVQNVIHSEAALAPEVEANPGWTFEGWDVSFDNITSPLTVIAQYRRLTYTVTFELDGKGTRIGGGELTQTIAYGEAALAPQVEAAPGWVFEGWDAPFDTVTGPLTVVAQYRRLTYTVTFDLDGKGTRIGGGELTQTVTYGEAALAPEVEAHPGWVFLGWDTAFDTVTRTLTIFAQYRRLTYTVTFDLDGKGVHVGGGELVQTVIHGESALAPQILPYAGWIFDGWDIPFDMVTGPLTVTARYRRITYTVTFDLDGKGTWTGGGELVQTVAYGEAATEPNFSVIPGWIFDGWEVSFDTITGPLTVMARYRAVSCTVTFVLDGKGRRIGGGALIQEVNYGGSAVAPFVVGDSGWIFEGWDVPFTNVTESLTVTARYSQATYTVTFNLGDKGTRVGGGELIQTVVHGAAALAPEVAAHTGWVFEGWNIPFNEVTSPLTVTAQYGIATYTVTFDLAGKGARAGGGELIQTVAHGAAALAPEVVTFTGWVFEGWNTSFNEITGPLTVTARYSTAIYTVMFDLDGKGTRVGGGELVQAVAHGSAALAPEVAATTGWLFQDWDKPFNIITGPLLVTARYISVPTPVITSVNPSKGPSDGGIQISISGHGFMVAGTTRVLFGDTAATNVITVNSGYGFLYITCILPAHTPGTVDVTVINPGGTLCTKPSAFTYVKTETQPPQITYLSPDTGSESGGITITLNGDGFQSQGTTQVLFDDSAATEVQVLSYGYGSRYVSCMLPPHAPGTVDVTIINPDAGADTKSEAFTYLEDAVEGEQQLPHAADLNADWRLDISETIAYLFGWQQGGNSIAWAIRAAYLWQNGERYTYDELQAPPLCWTLTP